MGSREVNRLRIKGVSRNLLEIQPLGLNLFSVVLIMASMFSNERGQQMKTMTSKYPGKCRKCMNPFPVGTEIQWSKETGAEHVDCQYPTNFALMQEMARDQHEREQLVPGVYETPSGVIYVVKPTREDKTRLYAKRFQELNGDHRTTEAGGRVDFEFVYERGAIYNIRLADRMPVERAKELITLYGRCINCSRHLKAAKSVEQGIGPVCIKSFGPVSNPVVETTDGRQIVRAA